MGDVDNVPYHICKSGIAFTTRRCVGVEKFNSHCLADSTHFNILC